MLTPGSLLQNRYRIVQPLGSGGQGAVYLALHLGLNAYVAIKESFSNDPHSNAQFQTEANLLAHLSHPNLPRVTDFFIEPNGARYLVMEYAQGENLEKFVQQRGAPIPESEALNWFRQIFDAVKYLHANRVIHRDIKPQNIIITPNGRAVLVDFGIAKVMASGALTGASMRFGSPGFAPPEQYSGGTDERSDIYSLGATLYFALTGQTPPEAPMRASGMKLIPPRQLNARISANVERAVLKAMSLDAGMRFTSVGEIEGAVFNATPTPIGMSRRNWWIPAGIALAALIIPFFIFAGGVLNPTLTTPTAFSTPTVPVVVSADSISPTATTSISSLLTVTAPSDNATIPQTSTSVATNTFIPPSPTLAPTNVPSGGTVPISKTNVGQIAQVANWGKGNIYQVAWSSNGEKLVVTSSLGIYIYDVNTMTEIDFIDTKFFGSPLALSADGLLVAGAKVDGSIQIWDWSSKQLKHTLEQEGSASELTFSPDGQILASGSDDTKVRLWDTTTGQMLRTFEGHTGTISDIAFNSNRRILASTAYYPDTTTRIWDLDNGQLLQMLKNSDEFESGQNVLMDQDGKIVITSSDRGVIRLWETETGQLLHRIQGDSYAGVAISPDGRTVASGDYFGNLIRLWNIATGRTERTIEGHTSIIRTVAFSPDARMLASGSSDGTIRLWDMNSGRALHTADGYADVVSGLAFIPNTKMLAMANWNHTTMLLDYLNSKILHKFEGHTSEVDSIAFNPNGDTLATASDRFDNTVRLWDSKTGEQLHVFNVDHPYTVAFSPDGKTLAAGIGDGSIQFWDANTSSPILTLRGHTGWISSIAFSPQGDKLVSGGAYQDNTARVWDTKNGQLLFKMNHPDIVRAVAFSPKGDVVATGSDDNNIRLWDSRTGILLLTLKGHTGSPDALVFTPDGMILISGAWGQDNTVRLWDTENGLLLRTLESGYRDAIASLALNSDGSLLAAGSSDGTVRFWAIPP